MSDDRATILDVYLACESIEGFLLGLDRETFDCDLKTRFAVLHQLMIIGEAVRRLTPTFRDSHPELNWQEFIGFRNVLIHQYDHINLDFVWKIATEEIPELRKWIEANSLIDPAGE